MHSEVTGASYNIMYFVMDVKICFSVSRTSAGGNQNLAEMCFPSSLLFPEVTVFLLLCLIQKSRLIPSQASTCFVTWKRASAIIYFPHYLGASCSPRVASLNSLLCCPQRRITLHSTVPMPRCGFQWGNCFDSLTQKKTHPKKKYTVIHFWWQGAFVKRRWNVSKNFFKTSRQYWIFWFYKKATCYKPGIISRWFKFQWLFHSCCS